MRRRGIFSLDIPMGKFFVYVLILDFQFSVVRYCFSSVLIGSLDLI